MVPSTALTSVQAATTRPSATRGELRNTAGRAGWRIDPRAAGGYVVAARSLIDVRLYVVVDDTAPVELPAWLAQLVAPPPPRSGGYATAALREASWAARCRCP